MDYKLLNIDYLMEKDINIEEIDKFISFDSLPQSIFLFNQIGISELFLMIAPKLRIICSNGDNIVMIRPGSVNMIDIIHKNNTILDRSKFIKMKKLSYDISCFQFLEYNDTIIIGTECGRLIWLKMNLKMFKCLKISNSPVRKIEQNSNKQFYVLYGDYNIGYFKDDDLEISKNIDLRNEINMEDNTATSFTIDRLREKRYISLENGQMYEEILDNKINKIGQFDYLIDKIEYVDNRDIILAVMDNSILLITPKLEGNDSITSKIILRDVEEIRKLNFIEEFNLLIISSLNCIRLMKMAKNSGKLTMVQNVNCDASDYIVIGEKMVILTTRGYLVTVDINN